MEIVSLHNSLQTDHKFGWNSSSDENNPGCKRYRFLGEGLSYDRVPVADFPRVDLCSHLSLSDMARVSTFRFGSTIRLTDAEVVELTTRVRNSVKGYFEHHPESINCFFVLEVRDRDDSREVQGYLVEGERSHVLFSSRFFEIAE